MKKLLALVGACLSVFVLSFAVPASAQSAAVQWIGGVRYLFVYNTTPVALRCGILESNGTWFWADIGPGQHVYKPIHPANAAQWNCVPI